MMTIAAIKSDERIGGYTQEQLQAAFTAVADPADWRAEIVAWVRRDQLAVTIAAVEFYTATKMQVLADDGDWFKLHSVGYRKGPAGDH